MRFLALPFVLAFCLLTSVSVAQEEFGTSQFNIGLGLGLDYGGLGTRITIIPDPSFGAFAAVGYNFADIGYNIGGNYYFLPTQKVCPYVTAMYGYNAVTLVEGASEFNDTFYGATFGGGLQLRSRRSPGNFWNFELLVPLRSSAYYSHIAEMKRNPFITDVTEAPPIAISIGYHIGI